MHYLQTKAFPFGLEWSTKLLIIITSCGSLEYQVFHYCIPICGFKRNFNYKLAYFRRHLKAAAQRWQAWRGRVLSQSAKDHIHINSLQWLFGACTWQPLSVWWGCHGNHSDLQQGGGLVVCCHDNCIIVHIQFCGGCCENKVIVATHSSHHITVTGSTQIIYHLSKSTTVLASKYT